MKYWNELLNQILGWHQYRVRFDYMIDGRVCFSFTRSIGVKERIFIDDHRRVKRELGPITNLPAIPKRLLCNGTLNMEPTCYLGRWKKAH